MKFLLGIYTGLDDTVHVHLCLHSFAMLHLVASILNSYYLSLKQLTLFTISFRI